MKRLIQLAVFLLVCSLGVATAQLESEKVYLYSPQGEIMGWESKDYMYDIEGQIIGYKMHDDKYVYIYSPEGDRIGYRKKVKSADYQYLYDSDGNVMGYYSGKGAASPFPRTTLPLESE